MSDKIIKSFDSDERINQNARRNINHELVQADNLSKINKTNYSNDFLEADQLDRTMENHDDFEIFNKRTNKNKTVANHSKIKPIIKKNDFRDRKKINYYKIKKINLLISSCLIIVFAVIFLGLIYLSTCKFSIQFMKKKPKTNQCVEKNVKKLKNALNENELENVEIQNNEI